MLVGSDAKDFVLSCLIVNDGVASKVTKIAKRNGITGATVFLGKGTVKNHFLELLDLNDVRKEVVLMVAEKETAYKALDVLNNEMHLHKPNHGIAFTISLSAMFGARDSSLNNVNESRGVEDAMYKAIFAVVDKGSGEEVVEAAKAAGSRGATIINARGSGIHETHTLFSMEIEPEKEVVMFIAESSTAESIVKAIRETFHIDEPGKGIMFVVDVNKTYGLY
jgi:nitrogen regulatory protein PII